MTDVADTEPADLHIGMKLRAVVRWLCDQEGILRYGAKFVPAE